MKKLLNLVLKILNPISNYWHFIIDFKKFKRLAITSRFDINWSDRYPRLNDKTDNTDFDRHYVYHTAWAARIVKEINPSKHVDISSSLHFGTILSAFIPVDFYDYRPAKLDLDNISSFSGDLMELPFSDESVDSLSCMHVVEHIGLGRYGDPIDPQGDIKAILELIRVVAKGGNLIFVTPVGKPRVMFNAHRIYSFEQIMDYFSDLNLVEFSLVPDSALKGSFIRNADPDLVKEQVYGCGCFHFVKE